jgi:hypothetical protein
MIRSAAVLLACAILLNGCSFVDNALLPALAGTSPLPTDAKAQQPNAEPASPTGTAVGLKVEELRAEITNVELSVSGQVQLRRSLAAAVNEQTTNYNRSVAAINEKLQFGTTLANPTLVSQWNNAQDRLEAHAASLDQMNKLSSAASSNAARCRYLLQAIRAAYSLPGGIDEDTKQLKALEDRVQAVAVTINRLYNGLTEAISLQTATSGEERAELNILSLAIDSGAPLGRSLASRAFAPPMTPPSPPGSGLATGRPLVTIRFDRVDVRYQEPLYEAVSEALKRRPNAGFDLVAVAPGGSSSVALSLTGARNNADQVFHALIAMGLAPDRVSQSSGVDQEARSEEVRLYVR